MSYNNGAVMTAKARRTRGGTRAATGMVPSDGRDQRAVEGAATNLKRRRGEEEKRGAETARTDYMVDDHDPLNARQALEAADLMMSQMKGGCAVTNIELLKILVKRARDFRKDADHYTRNAHMHAIREAPAQDVVDAVLTGFINDVGMWMGVDYGMYARDLAENLEPAEAETPNAGGAL